ncbi:MAG: hypothetical protein LBH59_05505 [Planctomycetaceae bacterium]|nr:hypothetical protein [Planctomycetaceae bacterium]
MRTEQFLTEDGEVVETNCFLYMSGSLNPEKWANYPLNVVVMRKNYLTQEHYSHNVLVRESMRQQRKAAGIKSGEERCPIIQH